MKASDLSPDVQRAIFGEVVAKAKASAKDDIEKAFAFQARAHRLPMCKREYKFAAEALGRGWRFDFCWVDFMVAVEIDCVTYKRVNGELIVGGRHVHPTGMRNDMEKYAHAAVMGWTVLRFEQEMVRNGSAIDFTKQLLMTRGWRP